MFSFSHEEEKQLLNIAYQSIEYGLAHGTYLKVNEQEYSEGLQNHSATFTTLNYSGMLRGCTGTLEAIQPLINAVARSAYNSAFHDSRFPPLQSSELDQLNISISILSPNEKLSFTDEENLLEQIRPGIDGVVLEYNGQKGTLLPSVWESIPDKHQFISTVKQKAGFPQDFWSNDIQVSRYTTHVIRD